MRRTALLVAALMAVVVVPRAHAATPVRIPVVAVIDSGVRATSHEFDYRGKDSTTDQFVGWWDFSKDVKGSFVDPKPGQLWDTRIPTPYDDNGHGTLTAGMVGGLNVSSQKTPSAYPGAKLAIAKVVEHDGTVDGDLPAALTWAVQTVHADVISLSIGSEVPMPADLDRPVLDAIQAAREAGVLVVLANGNGFLDEGLVPGDPGWANIPSASPYALAVGAPTSTGFKNSTDPEVAAVYTVTGPSNADDTSYVTNGGTSFGTPYVAGFAARVLLAARAGGHPLGVDALELFVKQSSLDSSYPPQTEGYGVVSQAQLPTAIANARAGRHPTRPSPDVSALYVEHVAGALRKGWTAA